MLSAPAAPVSAPARRPRHGLLLAPAHLVTDDPVTVYRLVVVVGSLAAAGAFPLAYLMLLQDAYPPFGDDAYPASLTFVEPEGPRRRLSVGFRLILIIPQLIVVGLLTIAWWVTSFVAWLAILVTGHYPEGLYQFGVGVLRWFIRVEAYLLLLVDEYPPFSFE